MSAVAAIDIGSNSVRLLITDAEGHELVREMNITRLAEGVDRTGRLLDAALDRTLAVLVEYGAHIRNSGAARIRVTATSAARDAANRQVLFDRAEEAVGGRPELLSGDEEAALSFAGATADQNPSEGPFVTLDIGGGSTEFALGSQHCDNSISLDIGCVRITERFLHSDPPSAAQLAAARDQVRALLSTVEQRVPCRNAATWLGLAGTVTTLAALDLGLDRYDPERSHGHRLTRESIVALHEELASMTVQSRASRLLEPKRAGVILGGTTVLAEVAEFFDLSHVVVSERDILDGLAASLRSST